MSKLISLVTWLICFSLLCSVATAAVYQWKDKNGVIHYSDQPRFSDVKKVKVDTHVPVDNYVKHRVQQRKKVLKTFDEAQAEQALKEEENSSEKAKKKIRCARASKLKKSYSSATQLYSKDQAGKKVVLNAQKKQAAMQEVNAYLAKWCQ